MAKRPTRIGHRRAKSTYCGPGTRHPSASTRSTVANRFRERRTVWASGYSTEIGAPPTDTSATGPRLSISDGRRSFAGIGRGPIKTTRPRPTEVRTDLTRSVQRSSGTQLSAPKFEMTTSKPGDCESRLWSGRHSNVAVDAYRAAFPRATSIMPGDSSIPWILCPCAASQIASSPVPQPMSRIRELGAATLDTRSARRKRNSRPVGEAPKERS